MHGAESSRLISLCTSACRLFWTNCFQRCGCKFCDLSVPTLLRFQKRGNSRTGLSSEPAKRIGCLFANGYVPVIETRDQDRYHSFRFVVDKA